MVKNQTRKRWTTQERIALATEMFKQKEYLDNGKVKINAANVYAAGVVHSSRSFGAVKAEINRFKKASVGEWNAGDNPSHKTTIDKVNTRRRILKAAGFIVGGPLELTFDDITITTGSSKSTSTTSTRDYVDHEGIFYFNVAGQPVARPNTNHEQECLDLLEAIVQYTNKNMRFLDNKSYQAIMKYVKVGIEYFDRDLLKYAGILKNSGWDKNNYREGANSIKGTFREIMACVMWNSNPDIGSHFSLSMSDKKSQVKGLDIVVSRPWWRSSYVVQVKGLYISDGKVLLYPDFFKYNTNNVDRLVLVNEQTKQLVHVGYQKMKALFNKGNTKVSLKYLEDHSKEFNFTYIK